MYNKNLNFCTFKIFAFAKKICRGRGGQEILKKLLRHFFFFKFLSMFICARAHVKTSDPIWEMLSEKHTAWLQPTQLIIFKVNSKYCLHQSTSIYTSLITFTCFPPRLLSFNVVIYSNLNSTRMLSFRRRV